MGVFVDVGTGDCVRDGVIEGVSSPLEIGIVVGVEAEPAQPAITRLTAISTPIKPFLLLSKVPLILPISSSHKDSSA